MHVHLCFQYSVIMRPDFSLLSPHTVVYLYARKAMETEVLAFQVSDLSLGCFLTLSIVKFKRSM